MENCGEMGGGSKKTSVQIRSVCLSAHLDSFCQTLDKVCEVEFVYASEDQGEMRRRVGWRLDAEYKNGPRTEEADKRAEECEVTIEMMREMELMERRAGKGLKTAFVSERWLKPLVVKGMRLPAILRLLVPSYCRMVRRFVRLMDDQNFWVLPCGVHAVRDFVRLYRLMKGDCRCVFRAPKVAIKRELGGEVEGFPRMKLWGYFVESSSASAERRLSCGSCDELSSARALTRLSRVDKEAVSACHASTESSVADRITPTPANPCSLTHPTSSLQAPAGANQARTEDGQFISPAQSVIDGAGQTPSGDLQAIDAGSSARAHILPTAPASKDSVGTEEGQTTSGERRVMRILWCGRMVDWKRVDVLIKAFKQASKQRAMALQIVGDGPEQARLKRLAGELGEDALKWTPGKISFNGYLPNSQVRELMHEADVYVMPSNAEEGWGAIVSEALVEGCPVISTWEAGSSATLLGDRRLYHANSVSELCARLLEFDGTPEAYDAKAWSGEAGAKKFMEIVGERK